MKLGDIMELKDCPRVLRDFLAYHETIKGQSSRTVAEYYLDLRMFLRFMVMIRSDMPYDTDLNTISIENVDLEFFKGITLEDVYDFFSYLSDDRIYHPETHHPGQGIENAARARKLSAIKSFYKYLTVKRNYFENNTCVNIETPKKKKQLPKELPKDYSLSSSSGSTSII